MNKIKIAAKTVGKFVDKNLPTILTGMALAGLFASVGTAIKEAPKAMEDIQDAKIEKAEKLARDSDDPNVLDIYRNEDGDLDLSLVKLTPWEKFKVYAPVYWPCALSTAATAACIVMSNRVSAKRYAALLTALSLNEKHLEEYKDKVKTLFGEKKAEEVRKEIAKDYAMDCPEEIQEEYAVGSVYPCCLKIAGLYFKSNPQNIERAFNRWNQKALRECGDAFLDDLLYELDIPVHDSWLYRHTSWNVVDGKGQLVEPVITAGETTTGIPCYIVDFDRAPDSYDS